ncbi:hypothetical protein FGO68_gene17182 [Halteria grandinella]|uniref:Right handed beta helix domain-containing protein n=1 Tax=Halteria grandinella TaxID=5974 RepID=A0A8J8TB13_HALGN|nr:hypothetical protein FGO68_gene17182 [Halteria grandinella]
MGKIIVQVGNLSVSNITLNDKMRMFTTQDIKYIELYLFFSSCNVTFNSLEKGYMFEFRHNFKEISLQKCLIADNSGYFMEITPSDQLDTSRPQTVIIKDTQFLRNQGQNYGLIHSAQNSQLRIKGCNFEENYSYGRGVIVYSEQSNTQVYIEESNFTRNYGYQGGVLYVDTYSEVQIIKSHFEENFAIIGGVVYQQSEGIITLESCNFTKNLAIKASLFYLYNSQNALQVNGGQIKVNGFSHSSERSLSGVFDSTDPHSFPYWSPKFFAFTQSQKANLLPQIQKDQEIDNPQIQLIKGTLIMSGGVKVTYQVGLMSVHSLSEVYIYDLEFSDTIGMKGPFLFSDQSKVHLNAHIAGTQSDYPLIEVQSDSEFICDRCNISGHIGLVLTVKDSQIVIENSTMSEIDNSKSQQPLIKQSKGSLIFSNFKIVNIHQDDQVLNQDIFRVRDIELYLNNFEARNFTTNLFHSINNHIQVYNSTFSDGIDLKQKGLIFYLEESSLRVENSTFQNLQAQLGAAIYAVQFQNTQKMKKISVMNCTFQNITAEAGGAIYTVDTNFEVLDSNFKGISVDDTGGALYLSCFLPMACEFLVRANTFTNNRALTKGGALFYNLFQPESLLSNVFENNSALYGANYASYPTKVNIITEDTLWSQAFVSGKDVSKELKVGIFDQNDQLIAIDSESDCVLSTDDLTLEIAGNTKVKAEKGIYTFTSLNLVAQPNYSTSLKFTTSSSVTPLEFPVAFRECIPGEVLQNRKCISCLRGSYSFDPSKIQCESCMAHATCLGGAEISVMRGYWRDTSLGNSNKIYQCMDEEACLGGVKSECEEGYKGIMCSECKGDIGNGKIYARVGGYKCAECKPLMQQISLILLVHMGKALIIIYMLYNLLQNPKRNKPQTVLVRIFTSYFQVVSIVKEFDLTWPDSVSMLLNKFSLVSSAQDSFYSFECVLTQMGVTKSTFYYSVAIVGLTPIAVFACSVPIWGFLTWQVQRRRRLGIRSMTTTFDTLGRTVVVNGRVRQQESIGSNSSRSDRMNHQYSSIYDEASEFSFFDKLLTTAFVIVMLWLPSIITTSFSVFMCTDFNGKSYLKRDTSVQCWTSEHLKMSFIVGFTFIVIWAILFPIIIDIILARGKDKFQETRHLRLYGIFYIGLNDDTYYWEIRIVSLRKISLILSAALISSSLQSYKGYIGMIALFFQRHLSHYKSPYIDPRFNDIDNYGTIASIFTIFGGILMIPDERQTYQQNEDLFKGLVFYLIVIYNGYFLGLWVFHFVSVQLRNHYGRIRRFFRYLKVEIKLIEPYEENLRKYLESMKQRKLDDQKRVQMRQETEKLEQISQNNIENIKNPKNKSVLDSSLKRELEALKQARRLSNDRGWKKKKTLEQSDTTDPALPHKSRQKLPPLINLDHPESSSRRAFMYDYQTDFMVPNQAILPIDSPQSMEDSIEKKIAQQSKFNRPAKLKLTKEVFSPVAAHQLQQPPTPGSVKFSTMKGESINKADDKFSRDRMMRSEKAKVTFKELMQEYQDNKTEINKEPPLQLTESPLPQHRQTSQPLRPFKNLVKQIQQPADAFTNFEHRKKIVSNSSSQASIK